MTDKKNGNGQADPIQAMREQAAQQAAAGTALAGALHTILAAWQHGDVINACFIIAASRAKMAGMKRADFRTGAGQVFDGISVAPQDGEAPSGLLAP